MSIPLIYQCQNIFHIDLWSIHLKCDLINCVTYDKYCYYYQESLNNIIILKIDT